MNRLLVTFLLASLLAFGTAAQGPTSELHFARLRGGFLMVDAFHGRCEWEVFDESMKRVFLDRPILDIPQDHEIFHLVYDLHEFRQIWGIVLLGSGITYGNEGRVPHRRGIYDNEAG